MNGGLTIARLHGIPVSVHYTLAIAFVLVATSMAVGSFPAAYPSWDAPTYWAAGAVAAALLFASILAHELAHAAAARRVGLRVQGITLFIFGGVAALGDEPRRPRDELLVAGVGPLASGLVAAVAWLGLGLVPWGSPGYAVLEYLSSTNLMLALFNLLPGFPLDGGRMLRALLWSNTGSLAKATTLASYAGQAVGLGLVGWGALQLLGGNTVGGLWIAFVGWFLNGAAEAERRRVAAGQAFAGVRVGDLATPEPPTVPPALPLDAFVYDWVVRRGARALAVVEGDRVVGVVSVTDARKIPVQEWPTVTVGAVMSRGDLAAVGPDEPLVAALGLMDERGLNQVLVVEQGHLVGVLTRAGVVHFLALRADQGTPLRRTGAQLKRVARLSPAG